MEESEKRKERLRAVRGGDGQDDHSSSTAPTPLLLNPLVQLSATPPGVDRSPPPSRFDYYTDPMSAYSGNRRWGLAHRPPDSFSSPVRASSPMAYISSPSSGQGRHYTSPAPVLANNFQVGYSPHQGSYVTPSPVPQYGLWSNPAGAAGPFSGHSSVGMPGSPSVSLGSSRGIFATPSFDQGVSPSADPGRGSWNANRGRGGGGGCGRGSPIVNSGRGSGRQPWSYQSPSSGRGSSQRGRFSKGSESARESPWKLFNKLMLLDPWDGLEPVVGCILEPETKPATPDSQQSWLPESIRAKRSKVKEASSVSHSQGSLADYIALAMEEAANDQTA